MAAARAAKASASASAASSMAASAPGIRRLVSATLVSSAAWNVLPAPSVSASVTFTCGVVMLPCGVKPTAPSPLLSECSVDRTAAGGDDGELEVPATSRRWWRAAYWQLTARARSARSSQAGRDTSCHKRRKLPPSIFPTSSALKPDLSIPSTSRGKAA